MRELGRGGMATVWLADDLRHDRQVALKLLHSELASSLGADRFLREIRIAARLQHPHILTVLDSGATAGPKGGLELLWYTMPYVEGETLRSRLAREGQLPLADALRVARDVAEALEHAHAHGVIHRDIKPENILLSPGHALVADFGIAAALQSPTDDTRLTETGVVLGTPHYMSPEQAAGERALDRRTDVYSLGCVLYEMLAGEPPFTGPTQQAILAKRLSAPTPRVGTVREVPPQVDEAVTRALARAPADRYGTTAELAAALDAPATTGRASRVRWRSRALVAGGLVATLVGAAVALGGRTTQRHDDAGPASAAVLPFVDLSPSKDQEYFSDGLTDELITSLSKIEGLRVAGRTSSFQFKGRNPDVRDVGRRLGVGAVLEGSVRRAGDRLRVNAQLVSAHDGYQLWSESYDRNPEDVFAVQEEIARAIVAALRVRLGAATDSALGARPTKDLDAYDLYLKGRFAWNQRTGASLHQAASWFGQAVARDSGFTRAWAGLADSYLLLPAYTGERQEDAWARARDAARRALAADPALADAHTSMAYGTMLYEWDWAGAEASFRRAIAANPNYPTAHHWYADFLTGRGRLDEALEQMQEARRLEPLSLIINAELAWVYYVMQRPAEAEAQIRQTLQLDPNFSHAYFIQGMILIQQRRPREAVASLEKAVQLGGVANHVSSALGAAYAAAGDSTAARRILGDFERRASREYVSSFSIAVIHTALGERRQAIDWLLRGIRTRDNLLTENFFDPLLDPLRSDPRYPEVLAGMGLSAPLSP
ncbi:MAG TPA: protein kinase [Gemmatimonadales bacterium]|nr:protein kinase [Gemmatimonadales bacterium]